MISKDRTRIKLSGDRDVATSYLPTAFKLLMEMRASNEFDLEVQDCHRKLPYADIHVSAVGEDCTVSVYGYPRPSFGEGKGSDSSKQFLERFSQVDAVQIYIHLDVIDKTWVSPTDTILLEDIKSGVLVALFDARGNYIKGAFSPIDRPFLGNETRLTEDDEHTVIPSLTGDLADEGGFGIPEAIVSFYYNKFGGIANNGYDRVSYSETAPSLLVGNCPQAFDTTTQKSTTPSKWVNKQNPFDIGFRAEYKATNISQFVHDPNFVDEIERPYPLWGNSEDDEAYTYSSPVYNANPNQNGAFVHVDENCGINTVSTIVITNEYGLMADGNYGLYAVTEGSVGTVVCDPANPLIARNDYIKSVQAYVSNGELGGDAIAFSEAYYCSPVFGDVCDSITFYTDVFPEQCSWVRADNGDPWTVEFFENCDDVKNGHARADFTKKPFQTFAVPARYSTGCTFHQNGIGMTLQYTDNAYMCNNQQFYYSCFANGFSTGSSKVIGEMTVFNTWEDGVPRGCVLSFLNIGYQTNFKKIYPYNWIGQEGWWYYGMWTFPIREHVFTVDRTPDSSGGLFTTHGVTFQIENHPSEQLPDLNESLITINTSFVITQLVKQLGMFLGATEVTDVSDRLCTASRLYAPVPTEVEGFNFNSVLSNKEMWGGVHPSVKHMTAHFCCIDKPIFNLVAFAVPLRKKTKETEEING